MEKKFKLLPPTMPNFILFEVGVRMRHEGFEPKNTIPVADLSEEEAKEYAELMRDKFIEHWANKVEQRKKDS